MPGHHHTCHHDHGTDPGDATGDRRRTGGPRPTRRRLLVAGAVAVAGPALSGCLGGDSAEAPAAVSLAGEKQCDVCGMVIDRNPGPNGQIFYRDNAPEGHDNPAWFDSPKACMFPYFFEHEELGWEAVALYATDYSAVDYDLVTESGKTFISSHAEPESFADARELSYVAESEVYGAMGRDFVPFSAESDATAFADDHGGRVLAFEDITPAMLG